MPFYVFAWAATLTYALVAISSKLVTKYSISNPWLMNFLWSLFISVDLIIVGLVLGVDFPTKWQGIIITGVFNSLFGIFYVLSLYKLDISVLSPLSNLRTAVTTILSVILLNESLSQREYILIFLIFIFGILVTYDEKLKFKSLIKPSIISAVLFILFASLWNISVNKAIAESGYWQTTIWSYFISVLLLFPTIFLFKKEIKQIRSRQILTTFFLAAGSVVGAIFSFRALQENVSVSSAIINLPVSVIAAFVLSLMAPKLLEKHPVRIYVVRLIAATVMIVSALQLSR